MSAIVEHTVLPPAGASTLPEVSAALVKIGTVALVLPDGSNVALPNEVVAALRDVVTAMEEGRAITIAPRDQVLTTQEAADFLGVSRPTLVRLLTEQKIPYTRPSRHRRVLLSDLIDYQERSRLERRAVLDEMSRDATEHGSVGDSFEATR
jgi:excisionase family DNA binding protein